LIVTVYLRVELELKKKKPPSCPDGLLSSFEPSDVRGDRLPVALPDRSAPALHGCSIIVLAASNAPRR
jgi:hypothetical protein